MVPDGAATLAIGIIVVEGMVKMREVTITVPDGVDKADARRAAVYAVEITAAVGAIREVLADTTLSPGPGRLAHAALREERWRAVEQVWGMLTGAEVAVRTGNKSDNARSVTANLRRRKGLTGVKRQGTLRYPGFQFVDEGESASEVAPAWTRLKGLLEDATGWSDAEMLAWAAAPNAFLDGRSPAEEVHKHPGEVTDDLGRAAFEAAPPPLLVLGSVE